MIFEELMHEHTVLLHMLSAAPKIAERILTDREVDGRKIEAIIDFSRHFTDGCHHTKEEKHPFPRLQERGMSKDAGHPAVMLDEQQIGRNLVNEIERALRDYCIAKENSHNALAQLLLQYIDLLTVRIVKENNVLFPMNDTILTLDD